MATRSILEAATDLPDADNEELAIRVMPKEADEFVCSLSDAPIATE
jgi:hypothetical protein